MADLGERENLLYSADRGQGRFYIETAEMWKDWQEQKGKVARAEQDFVVPRSYEEVKALRQGEIHHRQWRLAMQVRSEERARDTRKPMIPRYPAGLHPNPAKAKGQGKYSRRPRSPVSFLFDIAQRASFTSSPEPQAD